MVPNVTRTWAPRGQTPLLRVAGRWTKISAISAISVSPKRKRLVLYARFHPGKNIRSPEVAHFLRHLLRHIPGTVVLLWDRGRIHRAHSIQKLLDRHPRLHPDPFPCYAPELNPDEFIWAQLKRTVANSVPEDLGHLKQLLQPDVQRLRRSQRLLWSCIRASELPWP